MKNTTVRRLSINEDWNSIEESIYKAFCKIDHPTERPVWPWTCFKLPQFSASVKLPHRLLNSLVDQKETVWFIVTSDNHKLWFYEGLIGDIVQIIGESSYAIDEIYVASKKYQWLICINHHDVLIATGEIMPSRLKQLISI